jgi:heterodisulfide reductase subunit B
MINVAYYPGCSLTGMASEYDKSSRLICKHLGINLQEIKDWNCCGATSAHSLNHGLDVSLSARNLDLVKNMNLDHVTSPCPGCFSRLKGASHELKNNPEIRKTVEGLLGNSAPVEPEVSSLVQLIVEKYTMDDIARHVVKPLEGLKLAAYYGCLLTRPKEIVGFDDPELPVSLDNMMQSIGAETVVWGYKAECCGGGFSMSDTDIVVDLTAKILRSAYESGAEAIVVACPLCQTNLDTRQKEISEKDGINYNLPIIYFTQLMGIAYGYKASALGLKRLFISPLKLLKSKGLI